MSDDQNRKHPEPELTRRQHIPLKEYGLLKTFEWPDGTVITINTKKGEENMRIHHSSGVYHEFTSEGTHVAFNSNNKVEYSKGGMTVTYDNNGDTKAAGHMRVNFDHDAHVTFQKNASIVVGHKTSVACLGDMKVAAKGNLYLGSGQGKVVINGGKGIEMKGEQGRVMIEAASGVVYLHSKTGDVHLEAAQDVVMNSGQNNTTTAGADVTEQAQNNISENAGSQVNNMAGDKSVYDASNKVQVGPIAHLVEIKPGGSQLTPVSPQFE